MGAFRGFFTAPVWDHVLVLVAGVVLTPGKHTVSAALRMMGLSQAGDFALYHHVLSQARWDSRAIARKLLAMILDRFLPVGALIIGIDDTIERRWGPKIAARGIYRDPVRSSHGHFVKASGLRWLSFMAMMPLPWAKRRWALPFLTVLAPSQRYNESKGRRHKKLVDWARQGILQVKRWLPNRLIIIVADSTFSAIELIAAVRRHVCFVSRLRLDANLFEPPPDCRSGKRGRPPKKGRKLPKLAEILSDPATAWTTISMSEWYGGERCRLDIATGTAIWYHSGLPPVPIRWVLVRDPAGIRKPQAFLCTDLDATPAVILGWFVHRWSMETTFQETREHLGVETQRQWSDLAIARTTPALLGLFSLITLWAAEAKVALMLHPRSAAWYAQGGEVRLTQ
jgi:DDE superfamily endonuclease